MSLIHAGGYPSEESWHIQSNLNDENTCPWWGDSVDEINWSKESFPNLDRVHATTRVTVLLLFYPNAPFNTIIPIPNICILSHLPSRVPINFYLVHLAAGSPVPEPSQFRTNRRAIQAINIFPEGLSLTCCVSLRPGMQHCSGTLSSIGIQPLRLSLIIPDGTLYSRATISPLWQFANRCRLASNNVRKCVNIATVFRKWNKQDELLVVNFLSLSLSPVSPSPWIVQLASTQA